MAGVFVSSEFPGKAKVSSVGPQCAFASWVKRVGSRALWLICFGEDPLWVRALWLVLLGLILRFARIRRRQAVAESGAELTAFVEAETARHHVEVSGYCVLVPDRVTDKHTVVEVATTLLAGPDVRGQL